MAFKKWNIAEADKEKASAISEKFNIDPFVAYLLAARGKVSEIAVSEFLSDEIRMLSIHRKRRKLVHYIVGKRRKNHRLRRLRLRRRNVNRAFVFFFARYGGKC